MEEIEKDLELNEQWVRESLGSIAEEIMKERKGDYDEKDKDFPEGELRKAG